jgi:hypothetical protein
LASPWAALRSKASDEQLLAASCIRVTASSAPTMQQVVFGEEERGLAFAPHGVLVDCLHRSRLTHLVRRHVAEK